MSSPFVYKPPNTPVTYGLPQFQSPYIYSPRPATPFIPDSPMFPSSPYSRPPSLNPSPNRAAVPLPSFDFPERYPLRRAYDAGYDTIYEPRRERLPLWQEGNQSPWPGAPPPFSAPMDNVGLTAGVSPYSQRRRHSFSSAYSPLIQIHPLLNAEAPVDNFFFDLSSPTSDPLLYYRGGETTPVSPEHLAQPVTYPSITRLRIIFDTLPQDWDINIDLSHELYEFNVRAGYDSPPITVQDVLQALYHHMQLPITHNDWARLSREDMENVSRAFTRRCQTGPGGRDGYQAARAKGVKRIDYLRGKTRFVGLLNVGQEDGRDTLKCVTTDPYQPR